MQTKVGLKRTLQRAKKRKKKRKKAPHPPSPTGKRSPVMEKYTADGRCLVVVAGASSRRIRRRPPTTRIHGKTRGKKNTCNFFRYCYPQTIQPECAAAGIAVQSELHETSQLANQHPQHDDINPLHQQ